jgi:hypothetical protein
MSKDAIPSTDAELLAWSVNFKTLTMASAASFGLTEEQAQDFKDAQILYAAKYQLAFDPNTRTGPIIEQKDLAKASLEVIARELVRVAQAFPALTDDQRRALKITVRKPRTPNNRPTVRPGMDMVSAIDRTVTVNIHDSASSTKRGKPAGTTAAWVYTFVGENYPSDPSLWDFNGATTTGKFEITFPNTLPGGTQVWVCAAWINGKQEAGPTSVPITTNLQGGGSSSNESTMSIAA